MTQKLLKKLLKNNPSHRVCATDPNVQDHNLTFDHKKLRNNCIIIFLDDTTCNVSPKRYFDETTVRRNLYPPKTSPKIKYNRDNLKIRFSKTWNNVHYGKFTSQVNDAFWFRNSNFSPVAGRFSKRFAFNGNLEFREWKTTTKPKGTFRIQIPLQTGRKYFFTHDSQSFGHNMLKIVVNTLFLFPKFLHAASEFR